jgi:hypothetical protein
VTAEEEEKLRKAGYYDKLEQGRPKPEWSLDATWHFLNDPRNRPTPQVTIEAIWLCVRERGLKALEEPDNQARLKSCDSAARKEIERRVAKLKGTTSP